MEEISAVFKVTGPGLTQDRIVVTRSGIFAGRTPNNDLMLPHSQISRQHMRIFWQDGAFWVEDLGSTNGVWLNDARLEAKVAARVTPGDAIGAGPFMLTFEGLEGLTDPQPEPMRDMPRPIREIPPPAPIVSGVVELAPVTVRPPAARKNGASPMESLVPRVKLRENRYPQGIPRDRSNWLQYLPGIFSDPDLDPTHFMGRYLLVFESMFSPIVWLVDNFDLLLSPETAPAEWMQWMAGWFDILLLPELPVERQRTIMRQIGWLFLRRGTKVGLERLLELYFGVKPEIIENVDGPLHFVVRLPLRQNNSGLDVEIADRIIASQKPAHTTYTLEIV